MGQKRTRQAGALTLSRSSLIRIYRRLFACYGAQHWWPGETPFEIMVGAVLTQNTSWSNVELAITNLKAANLLEPAAMLRVNEPELAEQLRPSGYFNIKAGRLRALCEFLQLHPDLSLLEDGELRKALLSIHGIGPETADDILLYAFERPVFVIDAYTKRLFSRLSLTEADVEYETLRSAIEQALPADVSLFNEYHALIVWHAKQSCKTKPMCGRCCLRDLCIKASEKIGRRG